MYYYIYDQFLSHKKYDRVLAQIESRITDLGIKDRIIKMSVLKSVAELVTDALRKGAQNIVAVGNDKTIHQIVNIAAGQEVIFGIIPVGGQNSTADFLGITNNETACEIISARKIETINLGEINTEYFINSVRVFDHDIVFECNKKFRLTPLLKQKSVGIYNFAPAVDLSINWLKLKNKKFFNPQDNFLELLVGPNDKKSLNKILANIFKNTPEQLPDSIFRLKEVVINSAKENKIGSVLGDNFKILKTPVTIKISDKKIKMIVGKGRKF